MSDAVIEAQGLSMADFIQLYDSEGPFEWVEGERIFQMPNLPLHGLIAKWLFAFLSAYEKRFGTGEFFYEMPFVMLEASDWVRGSRVPDIMYYHLPRLQLYKEAHPDWRLKPFALVPDLVIEIISPSDSYSHLEEKIARYLADGVRVVWAIDPQNQVLKVHLADTPLQTRLSGADVLQGEALCGGLLPDFALPLAELFA